MTEPDHVSGNNHFLTGGAAYAAARPSYTTALVDALADRVARHDVALDVGCGSGQLSVLLANRFATVIATDPSAEQLRSAVAHPAVTYLQEPAEQISQPDRSVDLITAAQAAHWFDLDAFYQQVRRVGRPGAILALISYGVPVMTGPVGQRLHRFYWQDIYSFWPEGRRHVELGYQSLAFPFAEQPFPDLLIERTLTREQLLDYVETWSATKYARAAGQQVLLERFVEDLNQLWPDPKVPQDINWPIVGRIGPVHSD